MLATSCGKGVPNPDFTVKEYLGQKLQTLGVGFKYEFLQGGENGTIIYTIEPNYSGKFKKALLADNFFLRDNAGKIVNTIEGEIVTVSANHDVFNIEGELEKKISRRFGSSLFSRISRLLFHRDGYFVKDAEDHHLLDIQETWSSVLSPFLREYVIRDPQTGEEIGIIRNRAKVEGVLGAQTYESSLSRPTQENVRNLALVMRVVDEIEDKEEHK